MFNYWIYFYISLMRNHYHKLKQNIALKKSKKKDEDDHKNLHLNTAGMNSSLFTF
jgi:hypothetical protein